MEEVTDVEEAKEVVEEGRFFWEVMEGRKALLDFVLCGSRFQPRH